jgi:phosphate transport system protein
MAIEIRKNFHAEMDDIRAEIIRMAGIVTENLGRGTTAFLDGDLDLAEELILADDEVDALCIDVEERSFQLLALQQPMASDMRTIVTAIRIVPEIERSHDLVTNIVKTARRIHGTVLSPRIRGLVGQMGEEAQRLFRVAIDAYADLDASLADALDDMDDKMDALHVAFIESLLQTPAGDELALETAVQLALVGRFYERIGDHAVNIGERVHYMITGWMPEHNGAARLAARAKAALDDEPGRP